MLELSGRAPADFDRFICGQLADSDNESERTCTIRHAGETACFDDVHNSIHGPVLCSNILYKNLAIANRSRVSCAHNTLRASISINITL